MENRDRQVIKELDRAALSARLEYEGNPLCIFTAALNPAGNLDLYWQEVGKLKSELKSASRQQWRIIQEARAWDATPSFVSDWFTCRLALTRLQLAGVARHLGQVGLLDPGKAHKLIRDFIDSTATLAFD